MRPSDPPLRSQSRCPGPRPPSPSGATAHARSRSRGIPPNPATSDPSTAAASVGIAASICLLAPSSEPEAEDTAFPCCSAFTHLACIVCCAHSHGTCPNCGAAIDHLPREPGIAARFQYTTSAPHLPLLGFRRSNVYESMPDQLAAVHIAREDTVHLDVSGMLPVPI